MVYMLNTRYEIFYRDRKDNVELEDADGYADFYNKKIVICNLDDWINTTPKAIAERMKETLRHEIVHAFLFESGLSTCSGYTDHWAKNEEMVDWIAIQGSKIYEAWKSAGAI